ncbi:hypothetical protein LXA43DRAFT_1041601 [Ganoderma leucocontextum]|nr:hypothetical protein LXA43DRAFT_1041601 [Ganoderma leucocontextum]
MYRDPVRHRDPYMSALPDVMERDHWSFGIGRSSSGSRICSVPIELKEYDGVSRRSPVPFVVMLTPRDSSVAVAKDSKGLLRCPSSRIRGPTLVYLYSILVYDTGGGTSYPF